MAPLPIDMNDVKYIKSVLEIDADDEIKATTIHSYFKRREADERKKIRKELIAETNKYHNDSNIRILIYYYLS